MYELKGSGYKKIGKTGQWTGAHGARLNSKGITSAPAGWGTLDNEIKKIAPNIKPLNTDKKPTGQDKTGNNQYWQVREEGYLRYLNRSYSKKTKTATWKEASRFNFNKAGIALLNSEILGPFSTKEKTVELLINTLSKIVTGHKNVKNFEDLIPPMVNDDGTIGFDKFNKQYALIAYESYNYEDKVENIMFVNTTNQNYFITRNKEELAAAIDTRDVVISGGINWNDDQPKATPQYLRL